MPRYCVVEKLGGGSVGVVYKVEEASLGRALTCLACRRWRVFALMVMLSSGRLASQTATNEQKPLRFDLTPLVGYPTSAFPQGIRQAPISSLAGG
jgi:hypothetical protein